MSWRRDEFSAPYRRCASVSRARRLPSCSLRTRFSSRRLYDSGCLISPVTDPRRAEILASTSASGRRKVARLRLRQTRLHAPNRRTHRYRGHPVAPGAGRIADSSVAKLRPYASPRRDSSRNEGGCVLAANTWPKRLQGLQADQRLWSPHDCPTGEIEPAACSSTAV